VNGEDRPDRAKRAPDKTDDRRAREARALRENLRRRKAQSRARAESRDTESPSSGGKTD
jgi:hypothetical protein